MTKVFLSPSDQHANLYAGQKGLSERDVCRRIAAAAAGYLRAVKGVEVLVGADLAPRVDEYEQRVTASNAWAADLHVCIHTNAGEGGGLGLYYPDSAASKAFTRALLARVAPISAARDPGLRANGGLYELEGTRATAAYLELDRHDTPAGASEILSKIDAYGYAIAAGVCDYLHKAPPARPVTPAGNPPPKGPTMPAPLDAMAAAWNGGVYRPDDPRVNASGRVATLQEIADAKTLAGDALEAVKGLELTLDERLAKIEASIGKLAEVVAEIAAAVERDDALATPEAGK